MADLGDRLRRLRDMHDLSLRAFALAIASRTGHVVSHDSVRRYEHGDVRIPADFLAATCQAFGVSAEWLLLGKDLGKNRPTEHASGALDEIVRIVERLQGIRGVAPYQEPWAAVQSDWGRFIRGLPTSHYLRTAIIESWERSRTAGVDPTGGPPKPRRVTSRELDRRLEPARPLIMAAAPHLALLSALVGHVPHVAYLVCAEGIILHSVSNDPDLASAWGLEPGYDWSERAMGTNGAGTAVATGKVVAVVGPEHFMEAFHGSACLAAPIRDPENKTIGAIDLSTSVETCLTERLALIAYVAEKIETEMFASRGLSDFHKG